LKPPDEVVALRGKCDGHSVTFTADSYPALSNGDIVFKDKASSLGMNIQDFEELLGLVKWTSIAA
jgi:hypothetical protein